MTLQGRAAFDPVGWLAGARRLPSPNCDDRPVGIAIRLVVIHAISLPPGRFGGDEVGALFTNRLDTAADPYFSTLSDLRVSAHFFIRRDGAVVQFVPVSRRAWHAGVSCWRGAERCNDFSVGIELEGTEDCPFEESQYARLADLVRALKSEFPIEAVVGHSDVAAGRKWDPGPQFDWRRLSSLTSA